MLSAFFRHDGELSPADPVVLAPISWSDLQLSLVDLLTVHVHAHTSHDNADELWHDEHDGVQSRASIHASILFL